MMEKRATDLRAEEEQKGATAGDQAMTDEGASAAQSSSTMIDTTGGRSGGTLIGSSNPDFDVDITEDDERRGAFAFLAEQEKKTKFRDRLAIQLDAVKR